MCVCLCMAQIRCICEWPQSVVDSFLSLVSLRRLAVFSSCGDQSVIVIHTDTGRKKSIGFSFLAVFVSTKYPSNVNCKCNVMCKVQILNEKELFTMKTDRYAFEVCRRHRTHPCIDKRKRWETERQKVSEFILIPI